MQYGPIPATRILSIRTSGDRAACPRCGVMRETHRSKSGNRTGLCRDCRQGMSPKELKEWM